jgi:hypothetical protein
MKTGPSHLPLARALALLLSAAFTMAGSLVEAAVVDTFLTPPQTLVIGQPNGGAKVSSDPIELQSSLFETRRMVVSGGPQTLTVANGLVDYAVHQKPGTLSKSIGYFNIRYATSTPLDLIGAGYDRIRITFEESFSPWPPRMLDSTEF